MKVFYGAASARVARLSYHELRVGGVVIRRSAEGAWAVARSDGNALNRTAVPLVVRALVEALLGATNVELVEVPCESSDSDEQPRRVRKPVTKPRRPGWARTLGLALSCTVDDVARAYRMRAYACHPDRGGVAAEFIAITSARDQALAALGA